MFAFTYPLSTCTHQYVYVYEKVYQKRTWVSYLIGSTFSFFFVPFSAVCSGVQCRQVYIIIVVLNS